MLIKPDQRSLKLFNTIILAILLVLVTVLALVYLYRMVWQEGVQAVDKLAYQAVFLANDQVYFGHLSAINTDYPILDDVYYVQILSPGPASDKSASAGRVVRLIDSATHKPTNRMVLNRGQIIFWEDLSDRSPVLQKIMELKQTVQ